ncbi:SPOR domain-containing protein [Motiliproteus sp. SC1-56]|uniref:SPOR domain-containing protein n=1 Tax=Motiliproteus sp. SC1-56 TaxID=2799565 RepID=UPI001A8D2673|nr:SPOR domain-containing protein [Motiliproteus sp. SC1-56]
MTPPYCLYRQDDNGNRFLVARFERRRSAQARLQQLAAGGHKQLYWIENSRTKAVLWIG